MKFTISAKRLTTGPVTLVWGLVVVLGIAGMARYQMTPSTMGKDVPGSWPAGSSLNRTSARSLLVMFLHPQCPCSQASLYELSEIMARSNGQLDAYVLFVQPEHAPANWLDGDLWKQASAIAGVKVMVDPQGKNAIAFGAFTSGQVMLYDGTGLLRFDGGITDGRGHAGDNAGELAVLEILRHGQSGVAKTPVFGCSLGVCGVNPKGAGL